MIRLSALWDSVRASYWSVPSAMVMAGIALSFGVIELDRALAERVPDQLSWVYTGGPEGARAVLSAVASSMITVAGVTFSITIVALTLASQQFGPRLLRNFLRDFGNQVVLGTFVATFAYCLLVLRTVRGSDAAQFVPHLAVTAGVVLAVLSLGVLIYFIHHVAVSIQASQVIANVAADLDRAIAHLFPDALGQGDEQQAPPERREQQMPRDTESWIVRAGTYGYVQAIDGDRLMGVAVEHDLQLEVCAAPGAWVGKGRPLLEMWPREACSDDVEQQLLSAFVIGGQRTGTQDLGFFINQLVELAVRALSPGINDPTTARACVHRLEQALCELAGRRIPSERRFDDDGRLRVLARPAGFALAVDLAFEELARHARSDPSVTAALLDSLAAVGSCAHSREYRHVLLAQAERICRSSRQALTDARDKAEVEARHRALLETLGAPAATAG